MKLRCLLLTFIVLLIGCSSQRLPESNLEFAVSPPLFLKSEHSAVNDFNASLTVKSNEKATYHVRKVTTVLSTEARESGTLVLPYGGFQDISYVEGAIYSANGNLVRRLEKEDGMDLSLSGGYTLYEDTRIKMYELYYDDYPYTVVYDYEIELNGLLNLPVFYPQSQNQYVESARLNVEVPNEINLKHKVSNTPVTATKGIIGQDSVFNWQFRELKPLESEPFGRSFSDAIPKVLLAVESFKMGKSEGRLDSWDNFGQWYYKLAEGRNELPESVKKEITSIYERAPDKREGIKRLYEYMQDKTRYVSIQLGIGGWQPFEASFVEEKGYGDCKALTNYMQSILNHVGVEAYPVLIKNGISEADIVTDFPSNQFNHVILWIPEEDTIWLESTSQTIPFNYIGYGNSNRHGLAVTPDSSFLIKTPDYDYRINKLSNEARFKLDSEGNANIKIQSTYSGYYLDELIGNIAKKSDPERQKWVHEKLTLNSFDIVDADFSALDNRQNEPVLHLEIENPRYATKTSGRLFVPVNKLNRWERKLPVMDEERTEPIDFIFSFQERDSAVILIPEGFEVEAFPEPVELATDFGIYRLIITDMGDSQIKISRILELREKMFPANRYGDLVDFFSQVSRHDKKNIVLVDPGAS